MAKPLLERIARDVKPDGRMSDCRRDLAEAERERAETNARIAECESRSEDVALAEHEAKLALQQAADWRFYARRLDRAIAKLRDAIAAKEADTAHLERRRQYEAAKTERDALVERWRALAPVWDGLVALFADTVANDRLIAQVNQHRPRDTDFLRSAELLARGSLNGSYWPNSIGQNGEPFTRLTTMELPRLMGPGLAWSRDGDPRALAAERASQDRARHAAAIKLRAESTPEARAAAAKREEARWARYEIRQEHYRGFPIMGVRHRGGVAAVGNEPADLWLDQQGVEAAKAKGLIVQALADERV